MTDGLVYLDVPTYVVVTGVIEVAVCLLLVGACLTVVRRGAASLLGGIGSLLAGVAAGLELLAYRDADWWMSDRFWELTSYARAIGIALLGVALLLTLRRSRPVRA